MSETYHDSIEQPYRIQKRLSLNQCFRRIRADGIDLSSLVYVTFGGKELYDVMDLLAVFNLRDFNSLNVISYELHQPTAEHARSCFVTQALNQVTRVRVKVYDKAFPARLDYLAGLRTGKRFVYYLDYTGTFKRAQAGTIRILLESQLLRAGDYFLITSCLSPRYVGQDAFLAEQTTALKLYYGSAQTIDKEFKVRNHVDFLVNQVFIGYERIARATANGVALSPTLLCKFRYQDTRAPMGLWLYRVDQAPSPTSLTDSTFDDFPEAFKPLGAPVSVDEDLFGELFQE